MSIGRPKKYEQVFIVDGLSDGPEVYLTFKLAFDEVNKSFEGKLNRQKVYRSVSIEGGYFTEKDCGDEVRIIRRKLHK